MRYFPAFLDLDGQRVLVVGGGETAARKLRLLRRAGARVAVVAPRVVPEIESLAAEGGLDWLPRGFVAGDVAGCRLVHAATGIAAVDERVAEAAQAAGVPVNVVDRPELCSFVMPAIVDRDPVVVAISSGGAAPVLARRLRARLEALLPARLGSLAGFAGAFRGAVEAKIPDFAGRRRFWERFFDGPIADTVLRGEVCSARERMLALINGGAASRAAVSAGAAPGVVQIVGAGPGDPDLLSLRALRLLQDADVVVYDKLVGPEIVDFARRDAQRVYVGKSKGCHTKSQDEINAILLHHARAGKRVVRLKGGDPFVFGRGGEELAYLKAHGVEVEVVPGITAAAGCAAAAGIPLTFRGEAQAVTFLTGHATNGEPDLDWAGLVGGRQTLAIYMGVSTAGTMAARLIEHGLDPATPVAVIENGTLPNQKVATGSLAGLETLLRAQGIEGPALIIVGEVVRLAEEDFLPAPLTAPLRALAG
ncbi:MAG: siroheme synthase CysG [Rhodospirillales bacterium]|nr:siroheme synthase CysG [Rhodospirillales bacterium]